jgi:hypothetical protein
MPGLLDGIFLYQKFQFWLEFLWAFVYIFYVHFLYLLGISYSGLSGLRHLVNFIANIGIFFPGFV